MLESGLWQRLVADPTVSSLVGTRVYPLVWPSDDPVFPLITYQRISTVTDYGLLGPVDVVTARVQIDAWAKSYLSVRDITAAVSSCLEGFSGALPDSIEVLGIVLDSSSDLFDSPSSTYRITSDFLIQFRR